MADIYLDGLEALGLFFEKAVAHVPIAMRALAGFSAHLMKEKNTKIIGDNTKLASLAQATQDERTALGYSADEPLYRDGTLIRDSIEPVFESSAETAVAALVTDEKIVMYHEFGYVNFRTGQSVTPRPSLELSAHEAIPEIEGVIPETVGFITGLKPGFKLLADAKV